MSNFKLGESDYFYKFNNRDEFVQFVKSKRNSFDCPEDWESFFGFRLETDDDGNELETLAEFACRSYFTSEPSSYPCIAYCVIETGFDRFGKHRRYIFDIVDVIFE